jgi:hypothetical protein
VLGNANQIAAMSQAARGRLVREFPVGPMLEGFDAAAAAARSGGSRVQARPGLGDGAGDSA